MNIDRLLALGIPFLSGLATAFVSCLATLVYLFLAYRRLEHMEQLLNRCKIVNSTQRSWGNGFQGRIYRMAIVWNVLTFPKRFNKKGMIDLEQVKSFPAGLRRAVQISFLIALLPMLVMIAVIELS